MRSRLDNAVSTKDPLSLKSFEERGAAITGKLQRLVQDPRYQKLSPAERVYMRAQIYKQYVLPSFKEAGYQVPDMKTWLHGTKYEHVKNMNPADYMVPTDVDMINRFAAGARRTAAGIALFGLNLTKSSLKDMYQMGGWFFDRDASDEQIVHNATVAANHSLVNKAIKSVHDTQNQTNFWLQTHPRDTFLASAAQWTGEQIIQLPLYEALGGAIGAAAKGRIALGTAEGPAKSGVEALSKRLLTTGVGRFVAKRLRDASLGFTGSLTSGDKPSEAVGNAAGFAVMGWASDALIKGFSAKLAAMGGKPLVEMVTESAHAEAIGKGHGIINVPDIGIKDVGDVEVGNYQHMLGDVAVAPSIGGPNRGHFVYEGEVHPYTNAQQQQEVYNTLANRAKAIRKTEDPIVNDLHDAEVMALESLSQRHYGMAVKDLPPEFQAKLLQRRAELLNESMAELPAHVPELNKLEHEHSWEQQLQTNPDLAKSAADFEKETGIKLTDVVNENQINDIKEQTGIKNSTDAAAKVSKTKTAVDKTVKKSKDTKITPERFASYRIDTNAYFKNPYNAGERLAADGTKIGGRDKRTWQQRMKDENFDEFISTLKAADGDLIKFENPYHRLLYHWSNRDTLPQPVREKVLREMKKYNEKSGLKFSLKDYNTQADWALVHLTKLAQTGRLTSQRNMFKSTVVNGVRQTAWQMELNTELQQQELDFIKSTIKQHPGGKKAFDSTIKAMQKMRTSAKTAEDWMSYNTAIQNKINESIGGK